MLPIISDYDKEIMKMGIQQEFRRILNLMIEIETRDKFEPFINKWVDLKKRLEEDKWKK